MANSATPVADQRWCPKCGRYVSYLLSVEAAYCVECDGVVRLFSRDDEDAFRQSLGFRRAYVTLDEEMRARRRDKETKRAV
jgi:hypothetical protein